MNGRRWYGYALTAENRLASEQRQVLQAMWGAQKALSVRQLRSATRLSSACIRRIIEELQSDDRVIEGRRGETPVWSVLV